jgi:cell division protein ZapD
VVRYEYPLNESIRTMLRLEHLFDRLGQLIARDAAVDHHYALATVFEIMDVASRADLKSDLLKELERHKAQLNSYRGNPAISEAVLDQIVARIDHAFTGLNNLQGKAGQALTGNEWSRRHLRIRPAFLLCLAAAAAGTPARRPAAMDRHAHPAGRSLERAAQPAA